MKQTPNVDNLSRMLDVALEYALYYNTVYDVKHLT
jgi:hypothetical protein